MDIVRLSCYPEEPESSYSVVELILLFQKMRMRAVVIDLDPYLKGIYEETSSAFSL